MKFRICGDLDAPEWLLREVSVLSKLTNLRIKVIAGMVIKHVQGDTIDFQKVAKMTSAAELDSSEVKALIAALTFIICNVAKYNVHEEVIKNELQQFGLPKEHCDVIAKCFNDGVREALQEHFADQTFTLAKVTSVDWKVDYILSSNDREEANIPIVQIKLGVTDNNETTHHAFEVDQDKFSTFLGELKNARAIMETI